MIIGKRTATRPGYSPAPAALLLVSTVLLSFSPENCLHRLGYLWLKNRRDISSANVKQTPTIRVTDGTWFEPTKRVLGSHWVSLQSLALLLAERTIWVPLIGHYNTNKDQRSSLITAAPRAQHSVAPCVVLVFSERPTPV